MPKKHQPKPICPTCRKRSYLSLGRARHALTSLIDHVGDQPRFGCLNAYRCPVGNGWHVGHNHLVEKIFPVEAPNGGN